MKKFGVILVMMFTMLTLTSCVSTALAYDSNYSYVDNDNIVVHDGVCYVYYSNPTTVFLNTLHIVDGAYYYWYSNRYIPVVFPRWEVWSPHRFFYYERGGWTWRDRYRYNHAQYRRESRWVDYRRPNVRGPQGVPNHNMRPTPNRFNQQPPHNRVIPYRSSTRVTVRQPNNGRGGRK